MNHKVRESCKLKEENKQTNPWLCRQSLGSGETLVGVGFSMGQDLR